MEPQMQDILEQMCRGELTLEDLLADSEGWEIYDQEYIPEEERDRG